MTNNFAFVKVLLSTTDSFSIIGWSLSGLHWRKPFKRNVDLMFIQNLLKFGPLLFCNFIFRCAVKLALHRFFWRYNRLLIGVVDLNDLITCIFWPVITLFIVEKVIDIENMPKVNEAISFTSLVLTLFVHWNFQVVESIFMISVKISSNL